MYSPPGPLSAEAKRGRQDHLFPPPCFRREGDKGGGYVRFGK